MIVVPGSLITGLPGTHPSSIEALRPEGGLVTAIGINTWVWTSPLTDATLPGLLDTIAAMGFDGVELPLENVGDLDPDATAAALKDADLSAWVVGAMAPGRDLVATTPRSVGRDPGLPAWRASTSPSPSAHPPCAARSTRRPGRVWPMTADERDRDVRRVAGEPRPGRRLRR